MPDTSNDAFVIDKELMYSMIEVIKGTLNMSEIAEVMAKENPHLFIKAAKDIQRRRDNMDKAITSDMRQAYTLTNVNLFSALKTKSDT